MAYRYVYHGTSERYVQSILEHGLLPRSETQQSNWQENPSIQQHVYLTRLYPGYFALNTVEGDERVAIIEVDLARLTSENLYPDEDFVEQVLRDALEEKGLQSIEHRTAWARRNIAKFKEAWMDSLIHLGSVAHCGPIPPSAITRISLYDPKSNPAITLRLTDPTITLLNVKLCGEQYRLLTAWLMDDPVDPEEFITATYGRHFLTEEQEREFIAILANRNGLSQVPISR